MRKLLLAAALVLASTTAQAQNPQCPTRPAGDSTNACASTAFVQNAIGSPALPHTHIFVGNASGVATNFGTLATFSDVGTLNLTPTTGANLALNITQIGPTSGIVSGNMTYNQTLISDNTALNPAATSFTFGHRIILQVDGSTARNAGAIAFSGTVNHFIAASATSGDFIGLQGLAQGSQSQGGTNTGAGALGTYYGASLAGYAFIGSLNFLVVSGFEANAILDVGASTAHRWGGSFVGLGKLHGATSDASIEIGCAELTGCHQIGLFFNTIHSGGTFGPIDPTGTLIGTDASAFTVAKAIDLTNVTTTGNFITGPNSGANQFSITSAGGILGRSLTITNATVTGFYGPSGNFTNSVSIGTTTNHNVSIIANSAIAAYIDTANNSALNLGLSGTLTGKLCLNGSSSGFACITVPNAAGLPVLTIGSGSGTPAVTATAPLVITTATGNITCTTCTTSAASITINQIVIGAGSQGIASLGTLGTTTTVLHGNAGGAPTFGAVVSADLSITTTSCTNQFVTAISAGGVGTCTTDTLASAQHANQGTTTTVLHGNAAGNPSWASIALADLAVQNANTVLANVTSGSAVPTAFAMTSCSAATTSALIYTTNTGFGCRTDFTTNAIAAVGQLPGTTTNDDAAAGKVGEYIASTVTSTVSLTTMTAKTVGTGTSCSTSKSDTTAGCISLTAGDWDIRIIVYFVTGTTTNVVDYRASISTTTNTENLTTGFFSAAENQSAGIAPQNSATFSASVPPIRVSLSGTTSYFGIAFSQFSISTLNAYAIISARRVR